MPTDKRLLRICGILCLSILLMAVWSTRFVPMQDLPQHLFMAWLANHHADPALGLSEYFELRGQFGPYRASFLLQRLIEALAGIEIAAKVMVSLYLGLVFCLLLKAQAETRGRHLAWGALLLLPASFHPMYFYGFLNFTLSIPLLMLSLYDLRSMLTHPETRLGRTRQCTWALALFLVHPYTLLVYIVLASATIALPGWASGRVRPAVGVVAAVALFAAWSLLGGGSSGTLTLDLEKMRWWPADYNFQFLGMMFSGMRFSEEPHWPVLALWCLAALALLVGFWPRRREYRSGWWLPILCLLAIAGYFALPYSIKTEVRFTFFNVRLAPIFLFLLVALLAALPLKPVAGRLVAALAIALTVFSAQLHYRVAREVELILPLVERMAPGAVVLPLIMRSPSEHLDPTFYSNFHYHNVFYYPMLRGGGVIPDLFDNRLMPAAFREGKRPKRPRQRKLHRWAEYRDSYDYIITQGLPAQGHQQLNLHMTPLVRSGPWQLYGQPGW